MSDMHQLANSLAAESNFIEGCLRAANRPAEPPAPPSLLHSLRDILSRFRSCIAGGNGEIDGDKEAIAVAEAAIAAAIEGTATKTITIHIEGGLRQEVTGIPVGYELRVEDYDGDVMEKVKVDTEIRKLDQLRASHTNQQHNIRWQLKSLPEHLERSRKYHAAITGNILTRDAHADEDFTMKIGNREFSGKGAREEAGDALNTVVMSWRNDRTPKARGHFKGFEILSRGGPFDDSVPELFVRGKETYRTN